MKKISSEQDTYNVSVCTKSEASMIFNAINADKWLWPIFSCKVYQNIPIGIKLQLDV